MSFATSARLNRRFLCRLCKNWKNFTDRRSAFLECAEEWSMVSRQISPDISQRSVPAARKRNDVTVVYVSYLRKIFIWVGKFADGARRHSLRPRLCAYAKNHPKFHGSRGHHTTQG